MDDDKLDLSALDPSLDGAHWNDMVESVAARAAAQYRQRVTVAHQLAAWARPALAIAAALALVSWCGAWMRGTPQATRTTRTEQPASILSRWAAGHERPSAARMLDVLGGRDE